MKNKLTLLATALLTSLPLVGYSQMDGGPTPNPNGKQTTDMKAAEGMAPPVPADARPATDMAPNPNGKMTADPKVTEGMAPPTTEGTTMDDKSTMMLSADDKAFIATAAQGGMLEVKASELAEKNGKSAGVKEFASMMVTDHTKANMELSALAKSKDMAVPAELDEKHQAKYDALSKLTGGKFDKAYKSDMLAGHKKTVALFEATSESSKDADIKAFATKTLPTLKMHLAHIEKMASM